MRCPVQDGNPEALLSYSARTLSPETLNLLERHMSGCAECRRFAEAQQQVWTALDKWEAAPVSPGFDARLYARIEADGQRSWFRRLTSAGFGWKPALAGGMATLALVAALLIPGQRSTDPAQTPDPSQTQIRAESLEPEQLETALDDLDMLRQLTGTAVSSNSRPL